MKLMELMPRYTDLLWTISIANANTFYEFWKVFDRVEKRIFGCAPLMVDIW